MPKMLLIQTWSSLKPNGKNITVTATTVATVVMDITAATATQVTVTRVTAIRVTVTRVTVTRVTVTLAMAIAMATKVHASVFTSALETLKLYFQYCLA